MRRLLLETIVFFCGGVVMIYEITGSRVLGPFLGNSIFVWTSLIGIILASLSLGYYLGGRISDKRPTIKGLGIIILMAALLIFITTLGKDIFLTRLAGIIPGIKIQSVIASLLLFGPASIFLGMVSPYAVRLKLKDISTSGRTVGNLYAISTLGSIVGTFSAGFMLIPWLGTDNLLFFLSIILAILAIIVLVYTRKDWLLIMALCLIVLPSIKLISPKEKGNIILDTDTKYGRVLIYDGIDNWTGKQTRYMQINKNRSSGMILENGEPSFKYAHFYISAAKLIPESKNTLMLGGAAYTFPMYFLKEFPDARIDVVEIDPELTNLASEYFNFEHHKNLRIIHQDGRIYLNQATKKYDIFFGDAYNSLYTVPWHLTTIEAIQKIHDLLTHNGIAFFNIISSISGKKSDFLRAQVATLKEVFPEVKAYAVWDPGDTDLLQSIVVIASKNMFPPQTIIKEKSGKSSLMDKEITGMLKLDKPVLTDQHAPVEFYTNKAVD